jgi:hypothetical protein
LVGGSVVVGDPAWSAIDGASWRPADPFDDEREGPPHALKLNVTTSNAPNSGPQSGRLVMVGIS